MLPHEQMIHERLQDIDRLFDSFYRWFAGQYDPASGGFYYARSSITAESFEPDIESTAQALNIIDRSGLLPAWKSGCHRKMISFFQNRQDRASGYFYDRDEHMKQDAVMVSRALAYSRAALEKLGAEPLYPLPYVNGSMPEYLKSPESYVNWLSRIDLSNSWRGCDLMQSPTPYLAQMPESERRPYVQAAANYFAAIQDAETGLWGGGNLYVRISGTFKLNIFYQQFAVPLPRARNIYDTLLYCLRHEKAEDMCWIRNPIELLVCGLVEIPRGDLAEILEITADNMQKLLRPDGGFSREIDRSPPAPNVAQVKRGEYYPEMPEPVNLSLGLYEGDMNAGTQALLIRNVCYQLAGRPSRSLAEYTEPFVHLMKRHEHWRPNT